MIGNLAAADLMAADATLTDVALGLYRLFHLIVAWWLLLLAFLGLIAYIALCRPREP